jgi:hypothetical protein
MLIFYSFLCFKSSVNTHVLVLLGYQIPWLSHGRFRTDGRTDGRTDDRTMASGVSMT